MSDEVMLPALPSDSAGPDELRAAVRALIMWAQAREPLADGSTLDKFLTARNAVDLGQLTYVPGPGYVGGGGGGLVPGPGTSNPADATPPTPISGLTVTPGVTFFFIEFDSPNYLQGGGNGRTIIYQANYSGTGPLPTFADAVEAATVPGRSTIVVIDAEPGVQAHFWAKAETRHPTLQASPTGGTNGVSATAGQIDGAEHIVALSIGTAQIANLAVTNAKIVSMSVSKLTAGSIAVGEYIQSTGYTGSGVSEWRIDGNGVARFTGVIVSGTVYATGGEFGGVTINGALTMNATGHIKGGQTAYNTGTGFFLGYDSTAYKFSIGNATLGMTWDGAALTINGGGIFSGNVTGSIGGVGVAAVLSDISSRLRRDANEILGAVISVDTVASPAGFRAGTLTWDATGAYVSGSGVAMTPLGLVGYSGSTPTFAINASTGAATFAGALSAVTGSFGAVTVGGALTMNTGGHVKGGQTDYATGTGFFLGYSGAAYKFSIGSSSQSLTWDGSALAITGTLTVGSSPAVSGTTMTGSGGVINSSGTFALGNSTTNISFNDTTLTLNGQVVTEANLNWNALSGSIGSGNLTVAVSNGDQAYGSRTVTASGGTSPYTYLWSMGPVDSNVLPTSDRMYLTGTITSGTIGVSGYGTNNILTATVYCTITDANGRSAQASFTAQATHGTPP